MTLRIVSKSNQGGESHAIATQEDLAADAFRSRLPEFVTAMKISAVAYIIFGVIALTGVPLPGVPGGDSEKQFIQTHLGIYSLLLGLGCLITHRVMVSSGHS